MPSLRISLTHFGFTMTVVVVQVRSLRARNGDELFSAPSRSFHFTYSDSTAAFVRSSGSGRNGNGDRRVCQCFESFISSPTLAPLPPWRGLVTADEGSRGKDRGESLAQTDAIAAHFSPFFYSSLVLSRGSYPEMSAQRNSEGEGFHLYLIEVLGVRKYGTIFPNTRYP
jgi:hypothetical protein